MGRKRKSSMERRQRREGQMKKTRADNEYRGKERLRNSDDKRGTRTEPEFKEQERVNDAEVKQMQRSGDEYRAEERSRDMHAHREHRTDDAYRAKERDRDARAHMEQWNDPEKSNSRTHASWDNLLQEYLKEIKDGPTHTCASCGGKWFQKSVRTVTKIQFLQRGCTEDYVNKVLKKEHQPDEYKLCRTCITSAFKQEVPKRHLDNGFAFPDLPDVIRNLTQLEQRLVSPRIPFMQIRSIGVYLQKGLRGNVVNIENDLDSCAKVLPRKFDDSATVQVMLMRRMKYKAPYLFETVRPAVIYEAAKFLCQTELYKSEGITLSEEWHKEHSKLTETFVVDKSELSASPQAENKNAADVDSTSEEDDDNLNPGADETLIMREDDLVVKFAPGEGKKPMAWLRDINAEQLSFPSIYGGEPRNFPAKLKISAIDIARSEARMFDRRAVKPEKILYTAKRLQNRQVANQMQIWLRKRKCGKVVTAGQLKNEEFLDKLVAHDEGYRWLRKIRLSPAYWEGQQRKVLAMSRQLRIPTIFLTLSAAETKWAELLVILELVQHGRKITEEEALEMSFQQKAALIRDDPIVCALYFDHRFRSLLNLILNKKNGAFAPHELQDFYNKIEFAHRGSAHNHGLFWIRDAPIYDRDEEKSEQACIEFIDSVISCCRNGDEELEKVIGFQIHTHTHTCKRRTKDGGFKCRFNLPLPVLPETKILQPLGEADAEYAKAKADYLKIKEKLNSMGRNHTEDTPFAEYLSQLGMTESEYMSAIRTSIRRDKIFLKRRTCDIFVNAYNEKILKAWKANMDIQFILDPYACVKYCVSYLTKSCSGISKLMRDVEKEIRSGNLTMKEKMRKIANKFINCSEISAQEAAYLVLGLSLTNSSREDTFINTGPSNERVGLVKSKEDLQALHEDSADVYVPGLIHHYVQRPLELEETCLAIFASLYTYCKTKSSKSATPLLDGSGFLIPKTNARIVRYRRYNEQQDSANYIREQLMLYMPWRDEQRDLVLVCLKEKYEHNLEVVRGNRQYIDPNHGKQKVEDLVPDVERDVSRFQDGDNPTQDPDYETDLFEGTGQSRQDKKVEFLVPPKQIPNDQYEQMVRNLNEKQRRYFLHLVHSFKTRQLPFLEFVTGSAGAGKSVCISTIVQFMLRKYATHPGISLESLPVLVCAPTGKAAFNVGGVTVHCAFRLPPNQHSGPVAKLSEDLCNTLRLKFWNLELVIIDEISMLPLKLFYGIDSRLRQILQTNKPFGNISILCVGDFFQIRPPGAQFVFEVPRNEQFGFIIGNELWSLFRMYELTQIMRQNKALAFAKALNSMARGEMNDEDIILLKSREISDVLVPPSEAVHLFCTNKECASFNESLHNSLGTESAISQAHDTIQGARSDVQEERFRTYVRTLPSTETDGLPTTLRLQVGAEYMVSTNVNVPDGIFNGSNGRLEAIRYSTNTDGLLVPICAYLKFDSPMVGADARAEHIFPDNIHPTWTPIKILTKQLNSVGYHDGITVVRRQIPLLPANGMTVNKSQGSSYNWVVVHISPLMTREKLYVACSRVFTPEGLFIVGDFRAPPPPSQVVLDELRRLQNNEVQLRLQFLEDLPVNLYKIMYHNVQSLHRHYADIISDVGYLAADYMCLLEPWTFQNEQYLFPGFIDYRRQDCQGVRSAYGSFLASKDPLQHYAFTHVKSGPKAAHSFTSWRVANVLLCMVYKYPSASTKNFHHEMEQKLIQLADQFCVVFGDFNLNVIEDQQILALFEKYGFKFALPKNVPSTTGGTQLDLVFANFKEIQAWYYEATFSYHSPVCIAWPKVEELTLAEMSNLEDAFNALELKAKTSNDELHEPMDTTEYDGESIDESSEEAESSSGAGCSSPEGEERTSSEGEDGSDIVKLPEATIENARLTHWRVGGLNLSLNELKTLQPHVTPHEISVLTRAAAENNEGFVPDYITDQIVNCCLQINTTNTTSLAVDTGVVLFALNGVPLQAEEGDWNDYDNVFIPIHQGMHWTLMVVQPKLARILYLDPMLTDPLHHVDKQSTVDTLTTQARRILGTTTIQVQTPRKTNQVDAFNCGVLILKYTDQILNNLPLVFDMDPIEYRQELLQRLWQNADEFTRH